jgi:heme exporter protein B
MLQLPAAAFPALLGGLLMGTAVMSLLGTACAAIVLGARRGGVLLPVLVLPLTTPVLIFGAAAAAEPDSAKANLLLMAAYLAACIPLCPLAAGAALRAASE